MVGYVAEEGRIHLAPQNIFKFFAKNLDCILTAVLLNSSSP